MREKMPEMGGRKTLPRAIPAIAAISLQVFACVYFVADALADRPSLSASGAESLFEIVIALALLAGILLGGFYILSLIRDARRREAAVAIARGALSEILADRFTDWGLSDAEADVALFALKGCAIAQIADMRSAAPGTVRAQLSQVYAKAGVSSQAMLMSLFLDDLMDDEVIRPGR
jgi:DNA-binding CsgD family transcriptional regulator